MKTGSNCLFEGKLNKTGTHLLYRKAEEKRKMSIFTRFMDIVNSNINSLLDKAEDPEKMLKLMITEMEDTVIDLKTSTAARMAEIIRLEKKVKEAEETVGRWQKRAELAVEKGKEDLAREALGEKKSAAAERDRIRASVDSLKNAVEEGRKEIATLEEKIRGAKSRLESLRMESQRADERKKENVNLNARFEDLENRINRMNAYNELNKTKEEESSEAKFSRMERDEDIERELERIKKEKGTDL